MKGAAHPDGDADAPVPRAAERCGQSNMDETLKSVFALNRDAMLALQDGVLVYMNSAAETCFPGLAAGKGAAAFLPAHILEETAEQFVASAVICNMDYTVRGFVNGTLRLLSFIPQGSETGNGLLSDGLMAGMLSTLFNLELSVDCIAAQAAEMPLTEEYARILRHSCFSLKRQLTNLNLARQFETHSVYFHPLQTDLVSLCADLTETVCALTKDKHAMPRFSTPEAQLYASVDAELVKRLLLNLLSNSLRHTPPEGEVRLRLTRSEENAVLSLDDSGDGIPEDVLRNVFSRYETRLGGRNLSCGAGGGLGLSVASSIAKLHGGALVIESREGQGTSVRVMLPLERSGQSALNAPLHPLAPNDMDLILTELSGLLDNRFYAQKYLD